MTMNDETRRGSSSSLTKKAARGTIATIGLRLISFGCTQYTYRRIDDPAILGSTSISLELVLSTILFLSREGFRLTLLSSSPSSPSSSSSATDNSKEQTTQNSYDTNNDTASTTWNIVSWCTIPVSTIFSLIALLWHYYQCSSRTTETTTTTDYQIAGALYCFGACIEGYGEPAVLLALRDMNMTLKASAEGVAVVMKTASIPFLLSNPITRQYPICCFGLAQIIYSFSYTFFLYWHVRSKIHLPKFRTMTTTTTTTTTQRLYDPVLFHSYIKAVALFTIQGLFKHTLTEGDRIVLTVLAASYDQGVYAMGSSYGGLAARMLLQPLEENARLLWSRIIASESTTTSTLSSESTNRMTNLSTQQDLLRSSYVILVKLVLYVGCVFSCIAVNYTRIVLVVLAGRKWGNNQQAATVLSGFCVYTAFLAWNGMTEAFVYAVVASSSTSTTTTTPTTTNQTSTPQSSSNDTTTPNSTDEGVEQQKNNNSSRKQSITSDMSELSLAHMIIGCSFAVIAFISVSFYGTIGLVGANCIAMAIRSMYAVTFAARYFVRTSTNQQKNQLTIRNVLVQLLKEMIPKPLVLAAFFIAFIVTRISLQQMEGLKLDIGSRIWYIVAVRHISIGVTCAVGVLTIAYTIEKEFQQSLISLWKGKDGGNRTKPKTE